MPDLTLLVYQLMTLMLGMAVLFFDGGDIRILIDYLVQAQRSGREELWR